MTTGQSVETQEFLSKEPVPCRHMPFLCSALRHTLFRSHKFPYIYIYIYRERERARCTYICICLYVLFITKTRNIDRAIDHRLDPDSEQQPRILARARPKQDRARNLMLAAESGIQIIICCSGTGWPWNLHSFIGSCTNTRKPVALKECALTLAPKKLFVPPHRKNSLWSETAPRAEQFIGWDDNHFNNLHVNNSLEINQTLEMGIGKSLFVSQCLQCRLLR